MGLLRKTAVNCAIQHVLHSRNPIDLGARLLLDSLPFLQGQFVDLTRTSDAYGKVTKEDILEAINRAREVLDAKEQERKDMYREAAASLYTLPTPLPKTTKERFCSTFTAPVLKPVFSVRLDNVP